MKTIEITTRTIGEWMEFDKKIADKIIEKYCDINTDFSWYDDTIAEFVKEMEAKGLDINTKNVNFSGFSSQGDGASFTCNLSEKYINEWIIANKTEFPILYEKYTSWNEIEGKIVKNSFGNHYCHDKTVNVELDAYDDIGEEGGKEIDVLRDMIESALRGYMVSLYNTLEKEYTYLTSDECIVDTLKVNEYEFDIDGRIRG